MTLKASETLYKLQTALIALGTSAAIGCFAFLWQLNATLAIYQEKLEEHDRQFQNQKILNDHYETDDKNQEIRISILESHKK